MAEGSQSTFFDYDGTLWTTQVSTARMIDGARELKLDSHDVIVTTYNKSGTTWMKYIAHLIKNNGTEDEKLHFFSIPYLEMNRRKDEETVLKSYVDMPSPRLFTTHLPLRFMKKHFLETKVKLIVVMRNPKDTLVSFYHFYKMNQSFGPFGGSWDDFFELFKKKQIVGGDIIDFSTDLWKVRDHDNILVLMYEEMKQDLTAVVRKVAKFMDHELDDDVVQKIVHLASFEQMKGNPRINGEDLAKAGSFDFNKTKFMRKGKVGDWRNYFSEEQSLYVDQLCVERCSPIGLIFH